MIWAILIGVPVAFAFGWTVGSLQGKASLALDLEAMRRNLDIAQHRLARALADVQNMRDLNVGHDAAVSILRDASRPSAEGSPELPAADG